MQEHLQFVFKFIDELFGSFLNKEVKERFFSYFKYRVNFEPKDWNRFFQIQMSDYKFWKELNEKSPDWLNQISIQSSKKLKLTVFKSAIGSKITRGDTYIIGHNGLEKFNDETYSRSNDQISNQVIFGRLNSGFKPDIAFSEKETLISRSQAKIEYVSLTNQYLLTCTSSGDVCTSIQIQKDSLFTLEEDSVFTIGGDIIRITVEKLIPYFKKASSALEYKQGMIENIRFQDEETYTYKEITQK